MREMDWPVVDLEAGLLIDTGDLRVVREPPGGAMLISGDLAAAISALAPGAPMLGLGAERGTGPIAVRIARDRALLVSDAPLRVAAGWHVGAYATTPADDVWTVFTLSGPGARAVIAEAIAADPDSGSPSAAVHGPGVDCLLLRRAEGFVLFVETPLAWYFAEWLHASAQSLAAEVESVASPPNGNLY